jgi:hypothetical protein
MANTKVTGDVIANGTISTVHIADDAITAAKLDSTATGITFADLAVDTDTLYVDSSNNRVGIGTTSPSQKLEAVGIIKSSGSANSLMFSDRTTAANTWEWYSDGNNAGLYKNHNTASTVMTIDSSGNVGIGATSPNCKLDVEGIISPRGNQIRLASGTDGNHFLQKVTTGYSGTTVDGPMLQGHQGGELTTNNGGDSWSLRWATGGEVYMNGNVTVNNGNVQLVDSNKRITVDGSDIRIWQRSAANIQFLTNDLERIRIKDNGQVNISQKPNSGLAYDVLINVGASPDGVIGYTTVDQLAANIGASTSSNWVKSGNDIYNSNSGNVGIGTTSPSGVLTVAGSATQNSNNPGIELSNSNNLQTVLLIKNTTTRGYELAVGGSNTGIWSGSFYIYDASASDARLVINTSGSVGIGYTSPNQKLDVNGNIGIPGAGKIVFNNEPNAWFLHARASTTTPLMSTNLKNLLYCGGGASEGFTVTGVGQGDPSFEVTNNGYSRIKEALGISMNPLTDGGEFYINNGQTALNQGHPATSGSTQNAITRVFAGYGTYGEVLDTGFNVSSSPYAWIQATNHTSLAVNYSLVLNPNGGNVGIGIIPNNGYKLDVFDATEALFRIRTSNATGNGGVYIGNGDRNWSMLVRHSQGEAFEIRDETANVTRMSILSSGEFCIGTTETAVISTDTIHSIGQVLRQTIGSSAYARLIMQERQSNWISFVNGSGTHFGTIAVSGSGVSYGSNSDYRLKENIIQMTGALDRIAQLKPSRFNFIAEPEKTVDGFLAHEVQNIVPEAVTGEQDGTITTGNIINSNGNILEENVVEPEILETGTSFEATSTQPKYQQLDPAKLVPLLVGAIQEQQEIINDLKNRIQTLENN